MKKPKKPSAAAVRRHPAPKREDFKTGEAYAKACHTVSMARQVFDTPVKKTKPGNSKQAYEDRKKLFVFAYIANGCNGAQAAIQVGYKPGRAADKAAERLLKDVAVSRAIDEAGKEAAEIMGLSSERTLREVARLAYADPRKLYDADGKIKPVHTLDDDTAATIAGIEHENLKIAGKVVGRVVKLKQFDKNSALNMAMRYHGHFEKDNRQLKGESINLTVLFGK